MNEKRFSGGAFVVVTDTQTGRTRSYFNPFDRPAPPVQDTDAFPTCP